MEYSVLSMTPCYLFTQMLFFPSTAAQSQRERERERSHFLMGKTRLTASEIFPYFHVTQALSS